MMSQAGALDPKCINVPNARKMNMTVIITTMFVNLNDFGQGQGHATHGQMAKMKEI